MSYTASYIVNSSSAQGTTDFQFTFPYIKEEHIEVYLNYSKITQGSGSNQYQVITNVSPKLIRLNTGIASANLRVEVRRNSSLGSPLVDYADGSTLTANDLDTSALQSLYIDQELKDNQGKTVSVDETTGLPELNNLRLTNVADPTAAQDAATKNYVDTKQFTSAQIQDGTLVNADVNTSAAIDGTKISPNFGSQNIVTSGTVDGRDVSNDGIKLDSIETGATADQTNAEIRAAVEAASDSNVFTDADHSKLNAIEAGATADQTNAEIRAAVEAASDSNVFTDADHSKLNAIEANATADQTASEIKSLIAGSPLDNSHLAADSVRVSEIKDGEITAAKLNPGAVVTNSEQSGASVNDTSFFTTSASDARYFNISSGETIKDGDTFPDNDTTIATTAAINDRIIDLVDDVGGFVPIANETSFPNANPDVNNGTGTIVSIGSLAGNLTSNGSGVITIANGTVGNSTVTITGAANSTTYSAGYGLLVETTSTLNTYTFHRLSSKATEVSTVAGNISNINAVANNASNINSAVSNASNINSAVSNASNINSAVSNASNINTVAGNNTNINTVAGANSNISTVAGSISNVNTVGGSISNVNTVATNISNVNDFSDKYRVASSDPTSNNDEGDLCFNTTSNELRVYNGSAWQGGVTATGNLAGLGANTFTGNQSLGDNLKVQLGAGDDLQIYHNSIDNYIIGTTGDTYIRAADEVKLQSYVGSENMLVADYNGSVELYYDNVKKLETTSTGISVTSNINLPDSGRIYIGDDEDLEIRHNGSEGVIINTSSWLKIFTDSLRIKDKDDGDNHIVANHDGSVELYYDGSKKLHTKSTGVKITGSLDIADNDKVNLGSNYDLQIYHDGTDSYLTNATNDLYIKSTGDDIWIQAADNIMLQAQGSEHGIIVYGDGAVALYYDGVKKFETKSTGISISSGQRECNLTLQNDARTWKVVNYDYGDNGTDYLGFHDGVADRLIIQHDGHIHLPADNQKLVFGTGDDLQISHDGANSYVSQVTAGQNLFLKGDAVQIRSASNEQIIETGANGAVKLYYDNSLKLETTANGVRVPDNQYSYWGDNNDLWIGHNGSNSYIDNNVGHLYIASDHLDLTRGDRNENFITCTEGGAVDLYHDGNKKLETTSGGVDVTGALTVNGAALASGNTFTAVADGAIANNKPVTLKTNGKVAQIASSHAAAQPSAKDTEEMGQNGEYAVTVFDPDTNYVVCYNATGADVSLHYSTTLADSAGALASKQQTTVDVDGSGYGKPFTGSGNEAFHATYDTTNNRHVVCIISDYYFKSWLGSYSGSTLTFSGTATDPASANTGWKTPWIHHDPSTNRYVCAYIKTSNGTVYATQGTYNSNNNSITWGSEVSIGTGASSDDIAVCKAGTTTGKLMVLWKDGSNEYGKGVIVTTSTTSTSLSAGSVQTWEASALDNIRAVYNEEDNNVMTTFGGNGEEVSCKRLELDSAGTGIDADGGKVTVTSEQSHLDHRPIYSKAAKQVYVLYKNLGVSSSMYAKRITNSSGNPTLGSEVNIWSPFNLKNYTLGPGDSDPTSGCIFWAGAASNAGNPTLITSTRTTSASTNLTQPHHYVGFADAAYSDGQTATIKTYGNNVDTLSGLTAGTEYYVHADGSLATSWDSNNLGHFSGTNKPLAGTALSASKLLIRDPNAQN